MLDREEIDKVVGGEILESAKKSRPMVPLSEMKNDDASEFLTDSKEELKEYSELVNKKHKQYMDSKNSEDKSAEDETSEIKPSDEKGDE